MLLWNAMSRTQCTLGNDETTTVVRVVTPELETTQYHPPTVGGVTAKSFSRGIDCPDSPMTSKTSEHFGFGMFIDRSRPMFVNKRLADPVSCAGDTHFVDSI